MPRYIAFLRAINVGGHTIKMDALKALFEVMGFARVETYIASGNVIFETGASDRKQLERRIETALKDALGYEVNTFLRTDAEVGVMARYKAFTETKLKSAAALNIALLAAEPDAASQHRLMALKTDIDDFHVHGREVYWLCRVKQSDSKFSNAVLEKALGMRSTMRGVSTIEKLAAKYALG
jgi:uncharacterized protein (DUF1697 family)